MLITVGLLKSFPCPIYLLVNTYMRMYDPKITITRSQRSGSISMDVTPKSEFGQLKSFVKHHRARQRAKSDFKANLKWT